MHIRRLLTTGLVGYALLVGAAPVALVLDAVTQKTDTTYQAALAGSYGGLAFILDMYQTWDWCQSYGPQQTVQDCDLIPPYTGSLCAVWLHNATLTTANTMMQLQATKDMIARPCGSSTCGKEMAGIVRDALALSMYFGQRPLSAGNRTMPNAITAEVLLRTIQVTIQGLIFGDGPDRTSDYARVAPTLARRGLRSGTGTFLIKTRDLARNLIRSIKEMSRNVLRGVISSWNGLSGSSKNINTDSSEWDPYDPATDDWTVASNPDPGSNEALVSVKSWQSDSSESSLKKASQEAMLRVSAAADAHLAELGIDLEEMARGDGSEFSAALSQMKTFNPETFKGASAYFETLTRRGWYSKGIQKFLDRGVLAEIPELAEEDMEDWVEGKAGAAWVPGLDGQDIDELPEAPAMEDEQDWRSNEVFDRETYAKQHDGVEDIYDAAHYDIANVLEGFYDDTLDANANSKDADSGKGRKKGSEDGKKGGEDRKKGSEDRKKGSEGRKKGSEGRKEGKDRGKDGEERKGHKVDTPGGGKKGGPIRFLLGLFGDEGDDSGAEDEMSAEMGEMGTEGVP